MVRRVRFVAVVFFALLTVISSALPADAHARHRRAAGGFEPSETVLACIRGPWGNRSMESRGNYRAVNGRFRGAYQIGTSEWKSWGKGIWVDLDGEIHTAAAYVGHHQDAPALLQDSVARVGIRSRGLQPWPTPRRVCPRS